LKHPRRGISSTIALLVVVIIIAAAFYVEIPMVASSSTTSSVLSTSTPSTTSSSTTGGSTGTLTFKIPQPLIVAPGQDESVSVAFTALGNISGNYTLGATGLPSGVTATFQPSSVEFPSGLSSSVTMTLTAASGAAVVNSTVDVQAQSGSSPPFSQPFPIMSVQALVLIQGNSFKPASLTVPAGTKVYWIDLDPSVSPDLGPDMHDVTAVDHSFSSGTGALGQYAIYGHTFATAGTVNYESAQQGASMTGQVTVTG
jgi:plastocyanin